MTAGIMSTTCIHSSHTNADKLDGDDDHSTVTHERSTPSPQRHQQQVAQIRLKDIEEESQDERNFDKSPDSSPTFQDTHELIDHQEVVSITGSESGLLNLNSTNADVQVITNSGITTVTDNNGAIYLLVSNDTSGTMVHTGHSHESGVNIISADSLKDIEADPNSTVQITNREGIPVNINVSELLSTITGSKASLKDETSTPSSAHSILNLTSITSSESNSHCNISTGSGRGASQTNEQYILGAESASISRISNIPNWALHLRDCSLFGDTYTGYVTDEVQMDNVLNLYKKETQSLFAIRQTPSPSKDESIDTIRLMWKSQYVPYDGIPFVNVGRRATVMECEYGPRKRNNALKRMIQLHGNENALAKIPNLTCPARLFVKKVRKFPQFTVPADSDTKVLRQLQEQSLKLVRQSGFQTGEIRLYMQLPLPSAHRYHHIGSSLETFQQKEIDNSDDLIIDSLSVDTRVLEKIQQIVRQGFANPFLVRAAAKDFVENQIELGALEQTPYKHNKAFYPPLIEIQNIIQQTMAALNSGLLTRLPAPLLPPVPPKPKRKRSASDEICHSPLLIKKMTIDPKKPSDSMVSPTIPSEIGSVSHTKSILNDAVISTADTETISLTLTDSQLESFSVSNFTYNQLAQLAKIGLLALNNAAKDNTSMTVVTEEVALKSEAEKGVRLVNTPLPDCENNGSLLVQCNEHVEEGKKIVILPNGNIRDGLMPSNEITIDVVYK